MIDELSRHDKLLGCIYEAALNPARWEDTLVSIGGEVKAGMFHLQAWDDVACLDRLGVVSRGKEEALASYQAYYGRIDPRRVSCQRCAGLVSAQPVTLCHYYFDDDFVRHDEFFQDYLIPQCGRYTASMALPSLDGLKVQLDFVRSEPQRSFSGGDLAYLNRVAGHLQRAWLLMQQLQCREATCHLTQSLLDLSNLGAVVITSAGKIVQANRRGLAVLQAEAELKVVDGHLRAVEPDSDRELSKALQDALSRRAVTGIKVGRPEGAGRMCLTMMPTPPDVTAAHILPLSTVLCLIAQCGKNRLVTAGQLIQLFALSPAEARLARALAHGESIDGFAEANGIQRCTAKTQLQNTLRKTRTSDQKELIRLVLSLPAVR